MYHNTKKIDRLKENMTKAKKMNKVTRDGLWSVINTIKHAKINLCIEQHNKIHWNTFFHMKGLFFTETLNYDHFNFHFILSCTPAVAK
jgi:hypothetical protein